MNNQQKEIIMEYLKGMNGDFGNRTLARKIIAENQGVFSESDLDNVRSKIRYHRGAKGKEKRNRRGVIEEFKREEMKPSDYMSNFLKKGIKTAKPVWNLPKKHKSALVISDLHIPYHDMTAINAALDYGFSYGVDCIYINGDLIDFARISRWNKDPKTPSMMVEIDGVRAFLEGLCDLGLPVYYKLGNHEDRWNRYLIDNAPELYEVDRFQMSSVLDLDELGVELIDSKQRAKFGHLNVVHGHEFGQSIFSPVNPARGLFLRAKTSVLAGHNHQTSSHHEGNLNGKQVACFSTGCLCDMEPEYRPFAYGKWNHGAAIVDVSGQNYSVINFRIMNGRVIG